MNKRYAQIRLSAGVIISAMLATTVAVRGHASSSESIAEPEARRGQLECASVDGYSLGVDNIDSKNPFTVLQAAGAIDGVPSSTGYSTIWGSANNDIYVGGTGGAILHGDGANHWTVMASHTTDNLVSAWGTGAGNVYMLTSGGAVDHLVNGAWKLESLPTVPASAVFANTLNNSVWGTGATDIYAVSNGSVFHSAGDGTWALQTVPTHQQLAAVWGATADDVYAVGNGGTLLHTTDHGQKWTALESGTLIDLVSIWGADCDHVWVGGSSYLYHLENQELRLNHPDEVGNGYLITSMWGTDFSNVFFAGQNSPSYIDQSLGSGPLIHIPTTAGIYAGTAVFGFAADDIYVVTGDGQILHRS